MKNFLLLSCFLFLFSLGCVGPTGFLIDESQKSTLMDIDKLLLVIQVKSSYVLKAKKAGYEELDRYYVLKYASDILMRASGGVEVEYTDNKNTDKNFIFIKIRSRAFCGEYKPEFGKSKSGFYKCPGGRVWGNVSLYVKGEKIFFSRFSHFEPMKKQYHIVPNSGEKDALRSSKGFKYILEKIGSEIRKYSSK